MTLTAEDLDDLRSEIRCGATMMRFTTAGISWRPWVAACLSEASATSRCCSMNYRNPRRSNIPPSTRRCRRLPSCRLPSRPCRPPKHNDEWLDANGRPLETCTTSSQIAFLLKISNLTDKSFGALLYDFHTKRSRHVWLIAVTLDGNVFGSVEANVSAAFVNSFLVSLRRALITSNGMN